MRVGSLFLPVTVRQLLFYLLAVFALILFFLWDYKICYTVLTFALCGFYGAIIVFRLISVLWSALRGLAGKPAEHKITEAELKKLDPAALPVYTILVPMYKEPEVAQKIARAVTALDYPLEKLDVKLLLEEDDPETRRKIEEVLDQLPPCVEVLVCPKVPKGQPKTKPRACNWGLERARGEYLVIFDAEDRPERDQLKKAIVAFNRLSTKGKDHVACLQAKLNYFNARQNGLTRFFTLEYTAWFDLFLPGLHALRIPIPLGGTSNHFKTHVLKELGGWDPFNVTEDCDLGIRMARQGWRTEVLDSTTWEEATSRVGNWIRQRSRWIKGYLQTHLVHTRNSWIPALALAAFFWVLATLVGDDLATDRVRAPVELSMARTTLRLCQVGALMSLVLSVWSGVDRIRTRGRTGRIGELGLYHALTFRLTVGGLSAMLVLNTLFWVISTVYLFREPIARALPAFTNRVTVEGHTPRELLTGWQLYYTNVKDDKYLDYTIYKTTWQWLVVGKLDGDEARAIYASIDPWSYWSQVLYPVVTGLFVANFVFVVLGLFSCAKRQIWDLAPYAILMPAYWVLISIAAVKGAWQLFWNPWYWEKTVHGLAPPPAAGSNPRSPRASSDGTFYTAAR